MQIGAIGRQADPAVLSSIDPSWDVIAASPYPNLHIGNTPREITIPEIKQFVSFYAQAAHNAVHLAGFDGVEIHGGNGWLIDTSLKKVSNWRTDEYGGSAEARCRLALEVIEAVVKAVGEKKTAFRISPFFTSFREFSLPSYQLFYDLTRSNCCYTLFRFPFRDGRKGSRTNVHSPYIRNPHALPQLGLSPLDRTLHC